MPPLVLAPHTELRESGASCSTFSLTRMSFVRVVTQGQTGCALEAYERLKTPVSGETVRLLVPEVVTLELDRHQRTLSDDFTARLGVLKKHVNTFDYWSEIADLRETLLECVETAKHDKVQRVEDMLGEMLTFLRSEKPVSLPLTPDIMCRARKRLIAGRMPRAERVSDQDAMIVESLVRHFEESRLSEQRLLFCSANHRDFAEERAAENKARSFVFNPLLAEGLPTVEFFTDLDSLLGFDEGYEASYEPSSRVELPDIDEVEPDWAAIEQESREEIEAHFVSAVSPNLPEAIREQRKKLAPRCFVWVDAARASGSPSAGPPEAHPIGRRPLAALVGASDGRQGPEPQAVGKGCYCSRESAVALPKTRFLCSQSRPSKPSRRLPTVNSEEAKN